MKAKIYFSNEQSKIKISPKLRTLVKRAVETTLFRENFTSSSEVSVSFVDNKKIQELNLSFRGMDKPTDVLSFPMLEGGDEDGNINLSTGALTLGDIVISAEKAADQAREYGHSIEREICFLAVHSTLHLLGYDHETSSEDEEHMIKMQESVLSEMGLSREADT